MMLNITPREVARRLTSWGFKEPPTDRFPTQFAESDLVLLSENLSKTPPWLAAGTPVSLLRLISAALETGMTVQESASRLRNLGMKVPDLAELVQAALRRVPKHPGS
jgi:hypothetical protein